MKNFKVKKQKGIRQMQTLRQDEIKHIRIQIRDGDGITPGGLPDFRPPDSIGEKNE